MYEISVKRISKERVVKNDWQKTSDTGNRTGDGPIYQYVPHEEVEDVEVEVYRQKVEELNLADVVCVVNGVVSEILDKMTVSGAIKGSQL